MNECKWILFRNACMWQTECGRIQGYNVRPKQKKCFCGKKIRRVKVDELSPSDRVFVDLLSMVKKNEKENNIDIYG